MMKRSVVAPARLLPALVAVSLIAGMAGCGKSNDTVSAAPPQNAPSNAPYGYVPAPSQQQPQKSGGMFSNMSTGKKVALLAGTAALIYMYNKHKNAQGAGPQGKYYLSKNGRVYYRDAQGNAIWVTPPREGIQVPQDEAGAYQQAARNGQWDVNGAYGPSGPSGRY